MNPLTFIQAEHLKEIRPVTQRVIEDANELTLCFASACNHDFSPNCPACELWSLASKIEAAAEKLGHALDAHLERAEEEEPR